MPSFKVLVFRDGTLVGRLQDFKSASPVKTSNFAVATLLINQVPKGRIIAVSKDGESQVTNIILRISLS